MKLIIDGMNCGHCVKSVTNAVQSINPDAQVDIDLETKEVAIVGNISLQAVIEAISDAGFDYVGRAD
jgi:copper chaperone